MGEGIGDGINTIRKCDLETWQDSKALEVGMEIHYMICQKDRWYRKEMDFE